MNKQQKPVNVLVHAVGSPLGQSILKALQMSEMKINLYVCDIYHDAPGLFMVPPEFRLILPPVKASEFHSFLSEFITKREIQFIFPVISIEHDYYHNQESFYRHLGVHVITLNQKVYDLLNNKYECFEYLKEKGIRIPKSILADQDENYISQLTEIPSPYVLKPIYGASSNDLFIIKEKDRLIQFVKLYPVNYFMIQEFIDDKEEYTVGVYRSPKREYEDSLVIRRELKFGLSYKGEVIEDQSISEYALDVCRAFQTEYSANVQLKVRHGEGYVFEINPRLSSTTCVRAHFGFNEPEMIIKDLLGEVSYFNKRKGSFSRYWSEQYFEESL